MLLGWTLFSTVLGCILTYYSAEGYVRGAMCYSFATMNVSGPVYQCHFKTPSVVYRLLIQSGSCPYSFLSETVFDLEYIDATDVSREKIQYSTQMGVWDNDDTLTIDLLNQSIYTREFDLTSSSGLFHFCPHATVYVDHSCYPSSLCKINWCLNGGSCVGSDLCACAQGFFGPRCNMTVPELAVDNFEFSNMTSSILSSPSGTFIASPGNVNLSSPGSITLSDGGKIVLLNSVGRRRRHDPHHGHHPHPHPSSGHYGPHNGHYHGFHSVSSHSYSHSCSVGFGAHHNHAHPVYMYTTHGSNHHSPGASLHCHNGQLNMHVQGSTHHCSASAPLPPAPHGPHGHHDPHGPHGHHSYHVLTSYSPQYGCSIHVNGQFKGGNSPTHQIPNTPTAGNSGSLCMGNCGSTPNHNQSCTITSPAVATTSFPSLLLNNLTSLLGQLVGALYPKPTSAPVPTTLTTTPATTTTVPTTTTPLPTTTHVVHRASATTAINRMATTTASSTSAPLCYECSQMPADGACKNLNQCTTGQVCAVFNDTKGYTHRCMEEQVCKVGQTLTKASCWNCCNTNFCNQQCPKPCVDDPQCGVLLSTGYAVCGNAQVANQYCQKTCSIC